VVKEGVSKTHGGWSRRAYKYVRRVVNEGVSNTYAEAAAQTVKNEPRYVRWKIFDR
jgi:hypothetical protein